MQVWIREVVIMKIAPSFKSMLILINFHFDCFMARNDNVIELATDGLQNQTAWIIALASTNIVFVLVIVYCVIRKKKNQKIAEILEAELEMTDQVEGQKNVAVDQNDARREEPGSYIIDEEEQQAKVPKYTSEMEGDVTEGNAHGDV